LAWRDANVESHSQPANQGRPRCTAANGGSAEGHRKSGFRSTREPRCAVRKRDDLNVSAAASPRTSPARNAVSTNTFGPCLTECRTERGVGGSARCSRRHTEATSQRRPGDPGASDLDTEGLNWSSHCAKRCPGSIPTCAARLAPSGGGEVCSLRATHHPT
jgi:hypothetical protein